MLIYILFVLVFLGGCAIACRVVEAEIDHPISGILMGVLCATSIYLIVFGITQIHGGIECSSLALERAVIAIEIEGDPEIENRAEKIEKWNARVIKMQKLDSSLWTNWFVNDMYSDLELIEEVQYVPLMPSSSDAPLS